MSVGARWTTEVAEGAVSPVMSISIEMLLRKHGPTGKFVRAVCAQQGWVYGKTGAPSEWYDAWHNGLSAEVAQAFEVVFGR
jgi:membrane carboxypeptidase/penicillin-binding protein